MYGFLGKPVFDSIVSNPISNTYFNRYSNFHPAHRPKNIALDFPVGTIKPIAAGSLISCRFDFPADGHGLVKTGILRFIERNV